MKINKRKLIGLLFLVFFLNIFTAMYYTGTISVLETQNVEGSGNFPGDLQIFDEGYSPSINGVFQGEWWCFAEAPMFYVVIEDEESLDDAYYQVDSWEPNGTDTSGWTEIFTNHEGAYYEGSFQIIDSELWYSELDDGWHSLYLKAWDDDQNVTDGETIKKGFLKDTIPPTASIILPSSGTEVSGKIEIKVSAVDQGENASGILKVLFYDGDPESDGDYIGEVEDSGSYYKIEWNTQEVKNGPHDLHAKVFDYAYNYIITEKVIVTVKNKSNNLLLLIIVIGTVSAIAAATVTTFIVKFRRPSQYSPMSKKLAQTKQPIPSKISPPMVSAPQEPTYIIPEDTENMLKISNKINQLTLSEAEKQEILTELHGIPNGERINAFNSIIGTISVTEAQSQLNTLIKEIDILEKEENWKALLTKLDKGIELAEFLGDETIFNQLLTKIDEIKATKI